MAHAESTQHATAYLDTICFFERRGDADPVASARGHIARGNALHDTYAAVFRQRGLAERDAERALYDFLAGVLRAPRPLDWPALEAGLRQRLRATLGAA